MEKREVVLFIAMSLDGYIAGENDDLEFLKTVQDSDEDYGYAIFMESIDTIIIGRKTYEWVVNHVGEYPNKEKQTYVVTSNSKGNEDNLCFYSGNLNELIFKIREVPGRNILVDGGADVINQLLKENLIDAITVSVIPVLLGRGKKLFTDEYDYRKLNLKSCIPYNSGLVQLHYTVDNYSDMAFSDHEESY